MAERFVTFDITEVEEFTDNEENNNTRRKTKNKMALLSSFMAKEKENRQFEEILPQELLFSIYSKIRKGQLEYQRAHTILFRTFHYL